MHSIATVLELPQMQQRLTDINRELQRQDQNLAKVLGKFQQERDNQQHRQEQGRKKYTELNTNTDSSGLPL